MLCEMPIQCPRCLTWVDMLCFAYKVGEVHFHVCEKCIGQIASLDDALMVGYRTGFVAGMEKARSLLNDEENTKLS